MPLRRVITLLLLAFHAAAVALYSVPVLVPTGSIAATIRALSMPLIAPYILLTSQWQQWNLFGPDPERHAPSLIVEGIRDGEWTPLELLDADALPWWRGDRELSLLRRIVKKPGGLQLFTRSFCRIHGDIDAVRGTIIISRLPHPTRVERHGGWGNITIPQRAIEIPPFPCER